MWKDLSFKERAELIRQWGKQGLVDYEKMKIDYDANHVNTYEDGGYTNPMGYYHAGTIRDNNLRNQGITHVAELPEVKVSMRDPNKYNTAFEPLAMYNYTVQPALETAGKAVNTAINVATSPLYWANMAINGVGDDSVDRLRERIHDVAGKGMTLLSPTRDIASIASGFRYAPWSEDNPGLFGNDEMGQALNNMTDIVTAPAAAKITGNAAKAAYNGTMARARASIYNNITPWTYTPDFDMGDFHISKKNEIRDTAKQFFTPGSIDTSYPRWLQRFDEHIAKNPHDATMQSIYDYDTIETPAIMAFRDQAWAKAMRQPESERWQANIYKDNGDGTWSYDLDAVDKIRKGHGNPFSGEVSEGPLGIGFADNITTNGGGVGITRLPDGRYRMQDVWDIAPMQYYFDTFFPREKMPSIVKKAMDTPTGKKAVEKIKNFDVVKFFGGDPFKLDMRWDPNDPRFFE